MNREQFEQYAKDNNWTMSITPRTGIMEPYLKVSREGIAIYEPLVVGMIFTTLMKRMMIADGKFSAPEVQGVFPLFEECVCAK